MLTFRVRFSGFEILACGRAELCAVEIETIDDFEAQPDANGKISS